MGVMVPFATQTTTVTPAAAILPISVVQARMAGEKLAPKTATANRVIACFSCVLMGEKTIGVTHTTIAGMAIAIGCSLATETHREVVKRNLSLQNWRVLFNSSR
eukprot:TRINITY_DN176_c0_g1_i1.p1 TRINITY_DN176_c0_g1~~TRINITY_DN176_c0_g1_i1.p1  ORF type:complete len:120 (+),score=7.23 TRINITY_DN176_c0_g1_i1:49-360(+)